MVRSNKSPSYQKKTALNKKNKDSMSKRASRQKSQGTILVTPIPSTSLQSQRVKNSKTQTSAFRHNKSLKRRSDAKPTLEKEAEVDISKKELDSVQLVTHLGGCHCGAVRFSVAAPAHLDVVQCNCSICNKKQNHHFIVPKSRFKLIQGKKFLTTYTFNTHVAKHTFCKVCGVQSFYSPRSNPDGYGVMPHCLDPDTVKSTKVITFDGSNWEKSFKRSNITEYSKEPAQKRGRRS